MTKHFILTVFLSLLLIFNAFAQTPLTGVYTISGDASQNPDYTTIQAAINAAVANGVQGGVEFQIKPGIYNEFLTIPEIESLNVSNRITFRGMGTSNRDVTITGNAGYPEKPMIKLNGADFIIFKNLSVTTTSTNYANLVVFEKVENGNGVNYITFDSVYFEGMNVTSSSYNNDKHIVYDKSKSDTYVDSNIQFKNSEFVKGYMAFYLQGNNTLTPLDENLVIENCTFTNQYSKAIYVTFNKNILIKNNIINNNKDIASGFQGVDLYWVTENSIIENNNINIEFNTKKGIGIELRPGIGSEDNPLMVRNNMVRIISNASLNSGLTLSHASSKNIVIANNTVLIEGTGNGSVVYINAAIPSLKIYNNLFINNEDGYVIRHQNSNIAGLSSDYNRCKFSAGNFGRIGSTDYATLAEWQAASSNDENTKVLSSSPLISNSNLHITSSDSVKVANPLAYVTHDIDNELRSTTTPCAGADELASAANLPPFVANQIQNVTFMLFPDSTIINLSNTFSDPDDPDENIVISIASNSNPQLVHAELKADNRTLFVKRLLNQDGTVTITLNAASNGQSVQTNFTVTCSHQDQPPVVANAIEAVVFTQFPEEITRDLSNTFSDPDSPANQMVLSIQNFASTNFSAIIDNNILKLNRITSNAFSGETLTIRCTSNNLFVETTVEVSGNEVTITHGIATIEDVILGSNGIWQPADTGSNVMISNSWSFYNSYQPTYWGGFTASNRTDTTLTGMDAQYTAITGKGVNESEKYAVSYPAWNPTDVKPVDGVASVVTGCYVTNNLWTYRAILEGDGYSNQFGGATGNDPDYYRIWAVGKKENNQNTDTLFFYLADYRFTNNSEDFVVNKWEWFDLSNLGTVKSVRFGVESTKQNQWGITTPTYFCMDDFNGTPPTLPNQPPYVANYIPDVYFNNFPDYDTIDASQTFADPDDPIENIIVTITSNSDTSLVSATIDANKIIYLERKKADAGTVSIMLNAESNGQSINCFFNVHCIEIENQPPYVVNPIEEILLYNFPQDTTLSIYGTVTDPDNDDNLIEYELIKNSNSTDFVATLTDTILFVKRLKGIDSKTTLTIRATSAGQSIEFDVSVHAFEDVSVNITEIKNAIYPNPTTDFLYIDNSKLDSKHIKEYILLTINGHAVAQGIVSSNLINVVDLPKGQYILIIKDDKNNIIVKEKLIKI